MLFFKLVLFDILYNIFLFTVCGVDDILIKQ